MKSATAMKKKQLIHDILVLVGRLYAEDPITMAPETAEVMLRWRPRYKRMLEDAALNDFGNVRPYQCSATS